MVPNLKTYVKDEFDFLRNFPKTIPSKTKVVCFDVTSLYTSIPTDLGLKALHYWLEKLSHLVDKRFTINFVTNSIKFILENNYFQFDSMIWHQLCGTAMGKSFAPPYACLTMGFLEETILYPVILPRNYDPEICKIIIDFLMRYIDDDIIVLPDSLSTEHFLEVLNSMHPSIKYTASEPFLHSIDGKSYKCTNFLSIKVLVDENYTVKFDVHYKETNAHDYLSFDSHHPEHTKHNIPYVLAKRIIVISSEDAWVKRNLDDLRQFLLNRKYPDDVITKSFENAALQGPANKKSNEKIIPLITPFLGNYDSSNIVNFTRDLISVSSNERITNAFKNVKFVQCFTQRPNLLKSLSSSRFISTLPNIKERGNFHCSRSNCEICSYNYLQECKSFHTSNNTLWIIKCFANCKSLNVIYFLRCNQCSKETKLGKTDNFRERINNHRSACRLGKSTDIFDNHVFKCNKNGRKIEPLFTAHIMMVMSNYQKLLNMERKLLLNGHDTTFKLV